MGSLEVEGPELEPGRTLGSECRPLPLIADWAEVDVAEGVDAVADAGVARLLLPLEPQPATAKAAMLSISAE